MRTFHRLVLALALTSSLLAPGLAQAGLSPDASGIARLGGVLGPGARQDDAGRFALDYAIVLTAGERVVLRLSSPTLDTVLRVASPSGREHTNDDAAPGDVSSRLELIADRAGKFLVTATTYAPGATGEFELLVERSGASSVDGRSGERSAEAEAGTEARDPAADAAPGRSSGAGAGRRGRGRVLGLFVGLSDYGSGSRLDGCAEDAQRLAAALEARGVIAPGEATVLTDAEATVEAVRVAIRRVAAEARPDDVFVFFYSGHGGQLARTAGPEEADDLDETLVLRDGALRDHELDAELDRLRTDATLVALDACHSGGFARDLEGRRRIGLFSSEEGVLSTTAPRYGAGGYLSHFLLEGLGGGAASTDGVVRVGGLTNYLARQYAAHREEMSTHDDAGFETDQNLVVVRGASLGDRLWGPSRAGEGGVGGAGAPLARVARIPGKGRGTALDP